jgi:hypothetical protein
VFFTGQESQRTRTQNIAALHDDPSVRVMFLSDAGGVGLNLQRAANACINLELPWNPAVLEQRIGRIYRLGQEDPIDVINLVTEYGIEARIAGLVGNKQALFAGLFDGTTDAVRFDGPSSFVGEIERLIEPIDVPDLETSDDASEPPDDAIEPDLDAAPAGATTPVAQLDPPAPSGPSEGTEPSVDAPAPGLEPPAPFESKPLDLADLFARITVSRTPDGGVRIEAPPSAAADLTQLLEGLAGLLQNLKNAGGVRRE